MASGATARTAAASPARTRPGVGSGKRPELRLVPPLPADLRRGPFIALVLALVILGTIGLLVLNTVIAADSFRAEQLVARNAELAVAEQELRRQIAEGLSPQSLEAAARAIGMIPAGQPAFVVLAPDGSIVILGTPVPAGTR